MAEGAGDGAELVIRGEYLAGRALHDGDVVRVRPGTAGRARWGDLVAARSPGGDLAVGVLVPPPPGTAGPWVMSDWDGPLARLCCCGRPYLLGLVEPVALRRPGNRYGPLRTRDGGRVRGSPRRRVPLAYRRDAREPVRPAVAG